MSVQTKLVSVCFALLQTQIHKTLNFAKPKQAHIAISALRWPIGFLAIANSLFCLLAFLLLALLSFCFFFPGIAGSGIGVIHFLIFSGRVVFPNAGFCEGRRRIGIPRSEIGVWNGFLSDP